MKILFCICLTIFPFWNFGILAVHWSENPIRPVVMILQSAMKYIIKLRPYLVRCNVFFVIYTANKYKSAKHLNWRNLGRRRKLVFPFANLVCGVVIVGHGGPVPHCCYCVYKKLLVKRNKEKLSMVRCLTARINALDIVIRQVNAK